MAKVFSSIDDSLTRWIAQQAMFFVGTAPLSADGHVNVSPKGPIGSLAVTGPHQVAYLDIVGSGAETAAHIIENGRIVIMFCSFAKRPRIVRLHGQGRVVWAEDRAFGPLLDRFELPSPAVADLRRAIIVVDVERVSDSCGYGVPRMAFESDRDNAERWAQGLVRGGDHGLTRYKATKNTASLDGLPAWSAPQPEQPSR
ncbi:MAG: pyridoxamine 5'-phosphate oxidase family protein [Beutenbergiaceae bacterium]